MLKGDLVFLPPNRPLAAIGQNLFLRFVLGDRNDGLVAVGFHQTSGNPGILLVHHVHIVACGAGATFIFAHRETWLVVLLFRDFGWYDERVAETKRDREKRDYGRQSLAE